MKYPLIILSLLFFVSCVAQKKPANMRPMVNNFSKLAPVTAGGNYTMNIYSPSNVSAGVYNSSGKLVRTLFSNVPYTAGTYTLKYDGLDDDSLNLPAGIYTIKYLTDNVTANWDGSWIGNTSDSTQGPSKIRSFSSPLDICFDASNAYLANGYNEAFAANFYLSRSNLNAGKTYFGIATTYNNAYSICTDGNFIYMAMGGEMGSVNRKNTFVYGIKNSDKSVVTFPNGVTNNTASSGNFPSVIGLKDTLSAAAVITCVRVQQTHNFLFLTRAGINELVVLNKTTGATVQDYTIPGASYMTVDTFDNLWLVHNNVIEKYTVGNDGSLTSAGVSNTSFTAVGQIAASPDGTTIAVEDLDNQQIKGLSPSTGTVIKTLGTQGGYSASSVVTNFKYDFKDAFGYHVGMFAYAPDGSLFVGDNQNWRNLIYDNNWAYQSSFGFPPHVYNVGADVNNPTRVFADFLEYIIDYSKPLGARNGSWTLTNNYYPQVAGTSFDVNAKPGFRATSVFGHTYSLMRGAGSNGNKSFVVELSSAGLRQTGQSYSVNSLIMPDGSLYEFLPNVPPTYTITQYKPISLDGNNNVVWDAGHTIAAFNSAAIQPYFMTINGNKIGVYDISARNVTGGKDFHVAFGDTGTATYTAITAPGTDRPYYTGPFPNDQYFDNSNNVIGGLNGAGGNIFTTGNKIFFTNYHGESHFSAQDNMWNMWDGNNGLMIGQFGVVGNTIRNVEAAAGFAGNTITASIVAVNGKTYLYHNDESFGIHRWEIKNLNSISVQNAIYPSANPVIVRGIDLMPNLKRGETLSDGVDGWQVSSSYYTDNLNYFTTAIGSKTTDKFRKQDLYISFRNNTGSDYVSRSLGNNVNLSTWSISDSTLLYPLVYNEGSHNGSGQYIQVLDDAGKVIANFYIRQSPYSLMGNNSVLTNLPTNPALIDFYYYQPLSITYSNPALTFRYSSYSATTTTTVDAGANMKNPTTLRFYFYTNNPADNYSRQFTIKGLTFQKNVDAP